MPLAPTRASVRRFVLNQNHDVNVTPFVDVMLVLLIVFMVAAPLATTSIKVDIPPAIHPVRPTRPPTYLSIDRRGNVSVSFSTGGKSTLMRPATLANLSALVGQSLAVPNPTTQQVFIRADQHVRYGVFMSVVNQLQLDGYYKVGLISEEVQGG